MSSLRGLTHSTTVPTTVGALVGAGLATGYALLTLKLPREKIAPLLLITAASTGLAVLSGFLTQRRVLFPVLEAERDGGPTSPAKLQSAARALFAFPDHAFQVFLAHWVVASSVIGGLFFLLTQVELGTALRVAGVSAGMGPLTAVLVYLLVLGRVRAAIGRVAAAGLSVRELIQVAPPSRRQLRRRWLIFTAICVLTPSGLIADLVFHRSNLSLEAMLAATSRAAQLEALRAAESSAGGVPTVVLAALVLAVVIVVAAMSGGSLQRPMREITREATRIASGDLRTESVIVAEDEVWAASTAFARMQAQLVAALTELKRAGFQIGSTTEELAATSGRHEAGSNELAEALSATASTTEELARSARQIATNAQSVATLAEQTLQAAQGGMSSAGSFTTSMGRTREVNQAIADSVVKLNKRVQQIGKIVEFINEIADKSDLLALNAELEGTKAGEVGRGFSLVAAEMRRLAESVMSSTREINRLIDEIRDATHAAVMATEAGVKATDRGIALSEAMTQSLQSILSLARDTSDAIRSISIATQQQQTGTDQLSEAMLDILQSTQQASIASREVASANADLSALARDLQSVVARFTLS